MLDWNFEKDPPLDWWLIWMGIVVFVVPWVAGLIAMMVCLAWLASLP